MGAVILYRYIYLVDVSVVPSFTIKLFERRHEALVRLKRVLYGKIGSGGGHYKLSTLLHTTACDILIYVNEASDSHTSVYIVYV
jgi:hypothetical protein